MGSIRRPTFAICSAFCPSDRATATSSARPSTGVPRAPSSTPPARARDRLVHDPSTAVRGRAVGRELNRPASSRSQRGITPAQGEGRGLCSGYAVLSNSRREYVRAFRTQRHDDWREGLAGAFRHFGGTTQTVLIDNARALIVQRDREPTPCGCIRRSKRSVETGALWRGPASHTAPARRAKPSAASATRRETRSRADALIRGHTSKRISSGGWSWPMTAFTARRTSSRVFASSATRRQHCGRCQRGLCPCLRA